MFGPVERPRECTRCHRTLAAEAFAKLGPILRSGFPLRASHCRDCKRDYLRGWQNRPEQVERRVKWYRDRYGEDERFRAKEKARSRGAWKRRRRARRLDAIAGEDFS